MKYRAYCIAKGGWGEEITIIFEFEQNGFDLSKGGYDEKTLNGIAKELAKKIQIDEIVAISLVDCD